MGLRLKHCCGAASAGAKLIDRRKGADFGLGVRPSPVGSTTRRRSPAVTCTGLAGCSRGGSAPRWWARRGACEDQSVGYQDANLLAEIQRDALDPNVALADTLRKVIALGGAVGSNELRDWASLELRGYVGSDSPLPAYRNVPAILEVDGFAGAMQVSAFRISPRSLPEFAQNSIDEEVPLTNSIGEIEAMPRDAHTGGHAKFSLPMGQDLAAIMNF